MAGLMEGAAGLGMSSFMDSFNQTARIKNQRDIANNTQKRLQLQDVLTANKLKAEQEALKLKNDQNAAMGRVGAGLMRGQTLEEALSETGVDPIQLDPAKLSTIQKNLAETSDIKIVEVNGNQVAYNLKTGAQEILGPVTPKEFAPQEWQQKGPKGVDSETFKNERAFAKEWATSNKAFREADAQFNVVREAALANSSVGDLGLIYGIMKMFDPGSVVRESEFAMAQSAAGIPERLKVMVEGWKEGDRLTKEKRKEFSDLAARLFDSTDKLYTRSLGEFREKAEAYDFDPERTISDVKRRNGQGQTPTPEPGMMRGDGSQDSSGIDPRALELINKYKVQ